MTNPLAVAASVLLEILDALTTDVLLLSNGTNSKITGKGLNRSTRIMSL